MENTLTNKTQTAGVSLQVFFFSVHLHGLLGSLCSFLRVNVIQFKFTVV